MMIRKAGEADINAVAAIYDKLHTAEEKDEASIGWARGVYPVRATAEAALERDDLFVLEDGDSILGAGIINQIQVDSYYGAPWEHEVPDEEVCVFHTLVISPEASGKGLGREFMRFYEEYALAQGCTELRIDTNERNLRARAIYRKLGYKEIAVVPTVFNGIEGVNLVLLEKSLSGVAM